MLGIKTGTKTLFTETLNKNKLSQEKDCVFPSLCLLLVAYFPSFFGKKVKEKKPALDSILSVREDMIVGH